MKKKGLDKQQYLKESLMQIKEPFNIKDLSNNYTDVEIGINDLLEKEYLNKQGVSDESAELNKKPK